MFLLTAFIGLFGGLAPEKVVFLLDLSRRRLKVVGGLAELFKLIDRVVLKMKLS